MLEMFVCAAYIHMYAANIYVYIHFEQSTHREHLLSTLAVFDIFGAHSEATTEVLPTYAA